MQERRFGRGMGPLLVTPRDLNIAGRERAIGSCDAHFDVRGAGEEMEKGRQRVFCSGYALLLEREGRVREKDDGESVLVRGEAQARINEERLY